MWKVLCLIFFLIVSASSAPDDGAGVAAGSDVVGFKLSTKKPVEFLEFQRNKGIKVVQAEEPAEEGNEGGELDGVIGEAEVDPKGLLPAKIGDVFATLFFTCLFSFLPYIFHETKWFQRILQPLSVFAAGAFLGLAVLHLLPEALMAADEGDFGFHIGNSWYNATYPCIFAGFFLLLVSENILTTIFPDSRNCAEIKEHADLEASAKTFREETYQTDHGKNNHHGKSPPEEDQKNSPDRKFSSIVLFSTVALIFHSVFEGIVIGLMEDMLTLWISSFIIWGHKFPVALSLGVTCIKQKLIFKNAAVYLVLFAISTPIGIAIGTGVHAGNETAAAIFAALGSGVLLYAGAEATLHEFEHKKKELLPTLLNILYFLIGGCFVFGMMMLHLKSGGHDHGMGHVD